MVLRSRKPGSSHFIKHTVNALTKFLHIIIFVKKSGNIRIAEEVNGTEIIQTHDFRQDAGTLNRDPVIKHFNLYIVPLDTVIAVGDRVNDDFFPCKFRVLRSCMEKTVCAKLCVTLYCPTSL